MNDIKFFKVTINELGKTINYELDVDSRKEKIVKCMYKKVEKKENLLDSVSFAEKMYVFKKANELNEKYINNSIIDGIIVQIEIIYQNEEVKRITCKNKFPEEIEQIKDLIEV